VSHTLCTQSPACHSEHREESALKFTKAQLKLAWVLNLFYGSHRKCSGLTLHSEFFVVEAFYPGTSKGSYDIKIRKRTHFLSAEFSPSFASFEV
jgi:hypothetical protein